MSRLALGVLALACTLACALANAPAPAAAPAPLVWSVETNIDIAAPQAALATGCFAGTANASVGTVTVTLESSSMPSTRKWDPKLNAAVYTASAFAALGANPTCAALLAAASVVGTASVNTKTTTAAFAPLVVRNTATEGAQSWVVAVLACAMPGAYGPLLPTLSATVVFNQSAAALSAIPTTAACKVAESHSGAGKLQVAIVAAFGGIVWLATVFFVVKNTCSQQFFSFTNFIASVPVKASKASAAATAASSSSSQDENYDAVDIADGSTAPSAAGAGAASAGRKVRFDPRRKQHAAIKQSVAVVETITSFKAMPPKFAIALGAFVIIVVTGVWMSMLLASMEVANWPSWIGFGCTIVIIVLLVLWCYMRAQLGAQSSNEAVDQLQREFAYAVERAKEDMAEDELAEHAEH